METPPRLHAQQAQRTSGPGEGPGRQPYRTPQLTVYGNLRGITLGGSPGAGDSGQQDMEDMILFINDYNGLP